MMMQLRGILANMSINRYHFTMFMIIQSVCEHSEMSFQLLINVYYYNKLSVIMSLTKLEQLEFEYDMVCETLLHNPNDHVAQQEQDDIYDEYRKLSIDSKNYCAECCSYAVVTCQYH